MDRSEKMALLKKGKKKLSTKGPSKPSLPIVLKPSLCHLYQSLALRILRRPKRKLSNLAPRGHNQLKSLTYE